MVIQRLDTTKYAVIKLGICGTAIGLTLDSYILYNSSNIFSQLSSQQIMSFTIWMVIAYALYLIIPFVMERKDCYKEVFNPLYNSHIPERTNKTAQIKTNKGKKTETYGEHTIVSKFAPESDKT